MWADDYAGVYTTTYLCLWRHANNLNQPSLIVAQEVMQCQWYLQEISIAILKLWCLDNEIYLEYLH